jgi:membrane fusion protein (multidrug efflux system)
MRLLATAILATVGYAQTLELVSVVEKQVTRQTKLPGEFMPYETVDLRARVPGFIDKVLVDRGSTVKKGAVLIVLVAPEMKAQLAEAESKAQAAASQRAEAAARLAAAQATYDRLKEAAKTPGAIAGNELIQAQTTVDSAQAAVESAQNSLKAAQAVVEATRDLQSYLKVTAPFDGVITDRYVHSGALAGPTTGPLLKLDNSSRLRLVVAVPEADVAGIERGARVPFHVPAYPDQPFTGTIARISHTLDPKNRTESVELDVPNGRGQLAPGMYPEVTWPVRRARPSLLVPPASIASNTERTFVIRVNAQRRVEWVNVTRGAQAGDLVEVIGPLRAGDRLVKRASDEIREGSEIK